MKKRFKKSLLFIIIIIICGFCYMLKDTVIELENSSVIGINSSLADKDKLVKENGVNISPERLLVNRENGLNKDYIPEGLSIPNIPFSDKSEDEEKYVAGIIVKPLEELINTAKEEGIILFGNSGYRSYSSQKIFIRIGQNIKGKNLQMHM